MHTHHNNLNTVSHLHASPQTTLDLHVDHKLPARTRQTAWRPPPTPAQPAGRRSTTTTVDHRQPGQLLQQQRPGGRSAVSVAADLTRPQPWCCRSCCTAATVQPHRPVTTLCLGSCSTAAAACRSHRRATVAALCWAAVPAALESWLRQAQCRSCRPATTTAAATISSGWPSLCGLARCCCPILVGPAAAAATPQQQQPRLRPLACHSWQGSRCPGAGRQQHTPLAAARERCWQPGQLLRSSGCSSLKRQRASCRRPCSRRCANCSACKGARCSLDWRNRGNSTVAAFTNWSRWCFVCLNARMCVCLFSFIARRKAHLCLYCIIGECRQVCARHDAAQPARPAVASGLAKAIV